VHINNLYNTCFWQLVHSGETQKRAEELLSGTVSADKNELLFKRFGINYTNLPAMYRKGTILAWEEDTTPTTTTTTTTNTNTITSTTETKTDATTTIAAVPSKKGWKPTAEEIEKLRAEAKAAAAPRRYTISSFIHHINWII
jgi:tRNA(His) guanylyltransferase